ncbi:MAG: 50S ribosomal protein L24 [Thermomicrobiales bacterium]|nr:50S ribosomal protein L24 [Thermomicrobiales bacterium]
MRKIRRGDEVEVISGRNKGQRGKVRINLIDEDKVVVEGVNIVVKHIKRGRARQAGRVEVEAPMPVSKVMLICPSCGAKTRVGVRAGDDGKNARFCKSCDKTIARPTVD